MDGNNGRNTDGTFAPGNPGRPEGARRKATHAARALLDGDASALTRKAVDRALGADGAARLLCRERRAPTRKDVPASFPL